MNHYVPFLAYYPPHYPVNPVGALSAAIIGALL